MTSRKLTRGSCTEKEARWARWYLRKLCGFTVTLGAPDPAEGSLWPSVKASLLPQLAVRLISLHSIGHSQHSFVG